MYCLLKMLNLHSVSQIIYLLSFVTLFVTGHKSLEHMILEYSITLTLRVGLPTIYNIIYNLIKALLVWKVVTLCYGKNQTEYRLDWIIAPKHCRMVMKSDTILNNNWTANKHHLKQKFELYFFFTYNTGHGQHDKSGLFYSSANKDWAQTSLGQVCYEKKLASIHAASVQT